MSIKPIGIPDILTASWEFYKAKKALSLGDISEELSITKRRYHRTKVGIGALKLVLIGYATSEVILPMIQSQNFSNLDIGILATFAAGYSVLKFSDINSNILSDEANNYKYKQSELEEKFKIKSKKEAFEINAAEAYQLYMFGNKLLTSNPVDSFIFKIKDKINNWKKDFKLEESTEFGIIRNNIYKILIKVGIKSLFDKISSKALIKEELLETIKDFTDIKSSVNKEFMEHMKKNHKELFLNEDDIKIKLKEVNQEAIIKSYQKMLVQNLQLFFSQVVIDYNNGKVDKKLLEKFEKLNDQNTIKSKNIILFEEYSKISKISKMMINKEDLKDKFKTNSDVFKHLGSQFLTEDGKVKFINFDNIFKLERKSIINNRNGLNKINTNIYEDKKANFSELSFKNNLINQFSITKENKKINSNKLNNS